MSEGKDGRRTLLETKLVGEIDENVLDLLLRQRDVALRRPGGLEEHRYHRRKLQQRPTRGLGKERFFAIRPPSGLPPSTTFVGCPPAQAYLEVGYSRRARCASDDQSDSL
jgi:hypothetical protein